MGNRVLLFSVNQYDFPYPVYPLGVAHVEGALRQAGHETRLVDYNLEQRSVAEIVAGFPPDLVGISLRNIDDALIQKRQTFFDSLRSLCAELRQHTRAPVVLGGSGFSIFPGQLLARSGADFGIQGEGEKPLLALIDALQNGGDLDRVSGLVRRDGDRVRINPRDDVTAAADIVAAERADSLSKFYLEKSSMLNLQTQRGCALRCCYCTYPLLEGRKYRRRPAEAVVDEMESLHRRGARYVFIVDSVFNTSPAHVTGICEGLLRRGVRLQWCCFLRPQGLTGELMGLMARAGLKQVEFGADSFCDEVLEQYGKGLTFDDILRSSELAYQANVDYAHFVICGGPGETRETLRTSFANSRRFPNATIMARVGMRVYPGTPLFQRLVRERGQESLPDLLEPYYYISSAITEQEIFAELDDVARSMPNWIYKDPPETYYRMAERLRARGVVGPLWCYFAMMQRLGGGLPGGGGSTPAPGCA
jgi:radical SAM superfamily enzyme YgiQ (UPF0313 family)